MCKGDVPRSSSSNLPRRVAVVGGGVSGLAAAWHLQQNVDNIEVELFEAEDRLGGHAFTVNVDGTDVDIGFMVFNDSNYPNMVKWFDKLSVAHETSDMSLSVSLDGGKTVEWNSDGLSGLLARRSQAFEPSFYQMIRDMVRFNSEAADILLLPNDDPRKLVTTGQYLRNHGYSEAFGKYYLLPMMAALWSASMTEVLQFPAVQLISFLCNHKMLQLFDRPQVCYNDQLFGMSMNLPLSLPLFSSVVENRRRSLAAVHPEDEGHFGEERSIVDSDFSHEENRPKQWKAHV